MGIAFLADENISPIVISALREDGYNVKSVRDAGLLGASDLQLIVFAKNEKRVILTHDRDFGNLINFPLQSHCGVVLICYKDKSPENVTEKLLKLLDSLKGRVLYSLVVVTDDIVKIHKRHKY